MKSAVVIRLLEKDGWSLVGISGSHHHYRHPTKPGKVTVPTSQTGHPDPNALVDLETGRPPEAALMRNSPSGGKL